MLSAFVLAPDGRKVKCSCCGEMWFQLPDPDELRDDFDKKPEEIPDSVKPIPRGSGLPVIAEDDESDDDGRTQIGGAVAAAFIFVLIAAFLVFGRVSVIEAWPPAHKIYSMFGMAVPVAGEGLVFDRIQAQAESETGAITVSGVIINLEKRRAAVPVMAVELQGESGETRAFVMVQPPAGQIEPEAVMPFEATLPDENGAVNVSIRFLAGQ